VEAAFASELRSNVTADLDARRVVPMSARIEVAVRRIVAGLAFVVLTAHAASARDAVRADPPAAVAPPPAFEQIWIPSSGARLNGLLYLAGGPGPHPVVVFLHGYPGNERNLDIAQAVRRAGYSALFFDYRGNWGSGGTFSFAHALEDVGAALAWLRAPEQIAKYRLDPQRLALFGHSFGGWLGLMTLGREPADVCLAAVAAWNVGWAAQHEAERVASLEDIHDSTDPRGGPIHADGDALAREFTEGGLSWDYLEQAPALASHSLLLASARRDTADEGIAMHAELARRLRAAGAKRLRVAAFEDDHSLSAHRVALAELVVDWLGRDCASAWRR
jgi:pimeloyl-ACP methyl ester carboxylesterase